MPGLALRALCLALASAAFPGSSEAAAEGDGDPARWVAGQLGAAKVLAGLKALAGPAELSASAEPEAAELAAARTRAAARPLAKQLLELAGTGGGLSQGATDRGFRGLT
jgi:hypothetical protein